MADETWASFSLYRWPFNPAYAEVFDLVFKLSYTTDGQNTPRLEVFVDSDLAKEKDWRIYGAPGDESDDVAEINFSAAGERKPLILMSRFYMVEFAELRFEYRPIASETFVPVYYFKAAIIG
ncbi:hypothetical protein [Agrobacterium sp. lyk4-40-TYG-31]|uniref:hypothetical protein n=1 Tax=Agrobacterium sp. lyk4-40-TYG-31 TaxID=3040276 RepID=UPI00254DB723|nr:hypothetical protein [Agrobacterium sp. lyk4-40-TYG-31]